MPKFVVAALLLLTCACRTIQTEDDERPVLDVQSGGEIQLAAGETARVTESSVRITFTGVREDSRCPGDVTCVWAGNAAVRLSLRDANSAALDTVVNTGIEPRVIGFLAYSIGVAGLLPVPKSGQPIKSENYRVTLKVNAR
ncbi:MAG TPA: hypothetical protein VF042_15085 [Gemmatimonadaceae bacterium]